MAHRLLGCLLSLLLAFPPPLWAALACAAQATATQSTDFSAGLRRASTLASRLRAQINRAAFDLEALLEELDYEADSVIAFVKEQVAFESYGGLLRGPQGTLMSRAGNALDQSVLLAKLLRDAGYDARVARGQLNDAQVEQVLGQMRHDRLPAPGLGDVRAGVGILREFGFFAQVPDGELDKLITVVEQPPDIALLPEYPQFLETARFVSEQLNTAQSRPVPPVENPLAAEAKDYFWVEYKSAAAQPWTAVHPVFAAEPTFEQPEAVETLADSVPAELQHRVRIRMFIERRTGETLESVPVMSAWERPVANLVGVPLTFAGLPDSALRTEGANQPAAQVLQSAAYFVPILNGSPADGAQYFDRNGTLIDPTVADAAASGVVKQVGEAFGEAIGELAGESALPSLTALWIDLALIAPGGTETQYRRTLFDRVGPAARRSGTAPDALEPTTNQDLLPLLATHTLIVAAGRTPRGMAMDASLGQLQQSQPGIEVLLSETLDGPGALEKQQAAVKDMPGHWPGHLALLSRFDLVESWSAEHRIYRHEPLIAIHTVGAAGQDRAMARVDLVHNARRAVVVRPGMPAPDPDALVAAGVWDTVVEGSMLEPGDGRLNTGRVFELAREQGIGYRTILPGQAATGLSLPPDALAFLNDDLERGFAVIVPERMPAGSDRTGWWRVNPRTGETLGQLDDGRGVEVTEYMVVVTFGVIGYLLLKWQLYQCFAGHEPGPGAGAKLLCCVLANYAGYIVGTVFGVGLAIKVGEAVAGLAALNLDVWDIGVGLDERICNSILN